MKTKRKLYALACALFLAAAVGTLYSQPNTIDNKYPLYKNLEIFTDALTTIRKGYVEEISAKDLIHGAIRGMTEALDPHSQFLEPDEYKEMKVETRGEFGGLGIEISIKDRYLTIITPLEDTPAQSAGLKPGDRIIKINGKSTEKMTLDKAVKQLRGEPGTKVTLTILRPGKKEFMDFTVERSYIKLVSVKDAQIVDGHIAYIRITQFQENTASDLKNALDKMLPECRGGIILDLRYNPGGLLQSAVNVAGYFIGEPKLIVSTKGRMPDQNQEFRSDNKSALKGIPLVVLINKGSASGSEIVAGAVHDWHRGILIGTTSFGKGSVQSVLPLRDGSALKLTTAAYFTPSGVNINKIGIKPDIEVPLSEDQEEELWKMRKERKEKKRRFDLSKDPQAQRAIDLLKGLYIFKESASSETHTSGRQ